jgi:hypothetical protein
MVLQNIPSMRESHSIQGKLCFAVTKVSVTSPLMSFVRYNTANGKSYLSSLQILVCFIIEM